jgi:Fic-DOC domain mobile mystery protein B
MFDDVWTWAGKLRQREANIGIDPHQIAVALRALCDDTLAQIGDGNDLAYLADELAVRFHHRLLCVHPFANGNGRHSRLAADLLVTALGAAPFTWGGAELTTASDLRADYLAALRHADRGLDFTALIEFARRTS